MWVTENFINLADRKNEKMSEKENIIGKRRLRTSYLTSIVSIALVLYMLGILGLVVLHARKLSVYVKENIGFSVIMKENIKEADIMRLQKILDSRPYTKSTEYITKEKAAQILSKDLGEDFIGFLGYNPLLPSIDLRLNASYANNDSLSLLEKKILTEPTVKEVFYLKSLVHLVNENVRKISLFILGFSFLLLLIAIALINNTIRLSVYSKRFLIKTMQLVGATSYFIRKPFILRGILHGIYASIIAILLLSLTIGFFHNRVPELINLQDIDLYLFVFGIVILFGFIISCFSTFLAIRKYLNIKTDDLYY